MSNEYPNRLTRIGNGTKPEHSLYRCSCGTEREFIDKNVATGNTKSCGCLFKEQLAARNKATKTKHGAVGTSIYQVWQSAKQRCSNPEHTKWKDYGGRGITMCAWLQESFNNFIALMGDRPTAQHTLDRIENNDGYWCGRSDCTDCSPSKHKMNCRWATRREQANNRRTNLMIEWRGRTQTRIQWAEELGIPEPVLVGRLERGWTVEDAFTTPVRPYTKKLNVVPPTG